ncbi:hypothetical protein ANN_06700, partial [Periplaneta americana]
LKTALEEDRHVRQLQTKVDDLKQYQRRQCLRIFGLSQRSSAYNKSYVNVSKKVNRKHDTDNTKINWLPLRQIKITKDESYSVFRNTDFDENFVEVNINKRRPKSAPDLAGLLVPLWPNGKPVSLPKFQDIRSIVRLIPGDAKQFYLNLISDPNIEDDVDGIDGPLDFTLE